MDKNSGTIKNLSPNQKARQRFFKNKPAVFGAIIIVIAIVVAILGYLIAPDSTPNTNDQLLEVQLKPPGFGVTMLALTSNKEVEKKSLISKMLYGQPNPYKWIPINSYEFRSDSIIVEKYNGEDYEGKLKQGLKNRYLLADIAFPILSESLDSLKIASIKPIGNEIYFYDLNGAKQTKEVSKIRQQIESNHIFNKKYYLGTDVHGRCMLSRLILGVRISLLVGLIAVFISLTIGISLGAIAGYFGGRIDDLIMLLINTIWSIPTLLFVFAIVIGLGRGIGIIFFAVGLTMWVDVARIVRGQVMAFKEIQFVEAAQSMGFGTFRIIGKHILPNILGPVMVIAAANFATAILIEAGLSYLGFGIPPPTPSWGTMLNDNYGYAIGGKPFLAFVPAIAIMLMVLAFNLVGNGFRDALDVKTKI